MRGELGKKRDAVRQGPRPLREDGSGVRTEPKECDDKSSHCKIERRNEGWNNLRDRSGETGKVTHPRDGRLVTDGTLHSPRA